MAEATLSVFRGDQQGGTAVDYRVPLVPGMVVLDALHWIQAHLAPDLAVRWNCKAGKCGSCSAEVNGRPRLACKTRMDLSGDQGSGDGCLLEFHGQQKDPAFQSAARRGVEDGPARRRSRPGISQMHRVLSLPERLPRPARPQQTRTVWRPAVLRSYCFA